MTERSDDDRIKADTPSMMPGAPPAQIGRYELLERIGRGGMGVVYRARDVVLGRMVAVKMLAEDVEASDESRERFFREARSAGQLAHRNIITVYDFGEENGRAYLVMELLQGENLTGLLERDSRLPLEQCVDIMLRVCEGLAFAHSRAIVHRDIKPANLWVTSDGQVKILDFGLARVASSKLTRSGFIVGTPDYMAPEQVQGKRVDQRSDIFSAGAVFYQLLTGRKPFSARSMAQVMQKTVGEAPPPIDAEEAPAELSAIIVRALEKDPTARYQQIQDLLVDLARFLQAYDRQTREIGVKTFERYREVEALLAERNRLAVALKVGVEPEEISVAPLLREYPLFQEQGGEVLRVVPFRRARIIEIAGLLDEQHARLMEINARWRGGATLLQAVEARLGADDLEGALAAAEQAVAAVAESARAGAHVDRCRAVIQEKRARQERAAALLSEAREGLRAESWNVVQARLDDARQLVPTLEELADLQRQLERGRAASMDQRRRAVGELLERAGRSLARGDLEKAKSAVRDAIALDPDSAPAMAMLQQVAAARAEAVARAEAGARAEQAARAEEAARANAARVVATANRTELARPDAAVDKGGTPPLSPPVPTAPVRDESEISTVRRTDLGRLVTAAKEAVEATVVLSFDTEIGGRGSDDGDREPGPGIGGAENGTDKRRTTAEMAPTREPVVREEVAAVAMAAPASPTPGPAEPIAPRSPIPVSRPPIPDPRSPIDAPWIPKPAGVSAKSAAKRRRTAARAAARAALTSLTSAKNRPVLLASVTAVVVIAIGVAALRFTPASSESPSPTEPPNAPLAVATSSPPAPTPSAPVPPREPEPVAAAAPPSPESTAQVSTAGAPQPATPPRPPAPTVDPGVIAAVRRPNEAVAAWRRRSKELTDRYGQGKAALSRSEFDQAAKVLASLLADEPGFADAASLLTAAQDGSRAAARADLRARAQTEFDEGARREKSDDLAGALVSYRQAQRIDTTFEAPGPAIAALTPRVQAAAAEAYRRGNADDAFGRPSALGFYRRVVDLLPEGDPLRLKAQARLDVLEGKKP